MAGIERVLCRARMNCGSPGVAPRTIRIARAVVRPPSATHPPNHARAQLGSMDPWQPGSRIVRPRAGAVHPRAPLAARSVRRWARRRAAAADGCARSSGRPPSFRLRIPAHARTGASPRSSRARCSPSSRIRDPLRPGSAPPSGDPRYRSCARNPRSARRSRNPSRRGVRRSAHRPRFPRRPPARPCTRGRGAGRSRCP